LNQSFLYKNITFIKEPFIPGYSLEIMRYGKGVKMYRETSQKTTSDANTRSEKDCSGNYVVAAPLPPMLLFFNGNRKTYTDGNGKPALTPEELLDLPQAESVLARIESYGRSEGLRPLSGVSESRKYTLMLAPIDESGTVTGKTIPALVQPADVGSLVRRIMKSVDSVTGLEPLLGLPVTLVTQPRLIGDIEVRYPVGMVYPPLGVDAPLAP
jgi:hypothetical protein